MQGIPHDSDTIVQETVDNEVGESVSTLNNRLEKVDQARIVFEPYQKPRIDILIECPHCGVKQYAYSIPVFSAVKTIKTCSGTCASYIEIDFSLYQQVNVNGLVRKA